ncbi:MAG: hypothetical protein OXI34_00930 [Chloroflexota bacterium]|nr:hypothetical protein [Chloroflexota bacterium]MDE2947355.1 hypothetical protein [Chloroflexota bacterium]
MAENDPVLEQRVEALEQFSQTRVVEQVGELAERVSGLEHAREAEKPHLATKSDIARLEGLHAATQEQIAAQSAQFSKDLQAQSELFNTRLDAQSAQFSKDLKAQSVQLRKEWQDHMKQLAAWLIRTGIAVSGVIIAAAAIIINRLPS